MESGTIQWFTVVLDWAKSRLVLILSRMLWGRPSKNSKMHVVPVPAAFASEKSILKDMP
jgi:hypothetical protein